MLDSGIFTSREHDLWSSGFAEDNDAIINQSINAKSFE